MKMWGHYVVRTSNDIILFAWFLTLESRSDSLSVLDIFATSGEHTIIHG